MLQDVLLEKANYIKLDDLFMFVIIFIDVIIKITSNMLASIKER